MWKQDKNKIASVASSSAPVSIACPRWHFWWPSAHELLQPPAGVVAFAQVGPSLRFQSRAEAFDLQYIDLHWVPYASSTSTIWPGWPCYWLEDCETGLLVSLCFEPKDEISVLHINQGLLWCFHTQNFCRRNVPWLVSLSSCIISGGNHPSPSASDKWLHIRFPKENTFFLVKSCMWSHSTPKNTASNRFEKKELGCPYTSARQSTTRWLRRPAFHLTKRMSSRKYGNL